MQKQKANYTQSYVCSKSISAVLPHSNYENGLRVPPLDILKLLAEFYDTSLDYLVGMTDCPEKYPLPVPKCISLFATCQDMASPALNEVLSYACYRKQMEKHWPFLFIIFCYYNIFSLVLQYVALQNEPAEPFYSHFSHIKFWRRYQLMSNTNYPRQLQQLGLNIARYRKLRGLTQEELAALISMEPDTSEQSGSSGKDHLISLESCLRLQTF